MRVTDILSELDRQLGPLERQSETAKIYLEQKSRLKEKEAGLFLLEMEAVSYTHLDVYKRQILTWGYPRNVAFFSTERYEQIRKEMGLEDKQVVVYMPTWRGMLHKKENAKQIQILVQHLMKLRCV